MLFNGSLSPRQTAGSLPSSTNYYAHDVASFRHPRCFSILTMLHNNGVEVSLRMAPTVVWLEEINSYMQVAQHRFISTLTPPDMTPAQYELYLMNFNNLSKKEGVMQAIYQRHRVDTPAGSRTLGGMWSNMMGHELSFCTNDNADTVPFLLIDDVLILERPCSSHDARHYLYVADHVEETVVLQLLRMSAMGLTTALIDQFIMKDR